MCFFDLGTVARFEIEIETRVYYCSVRFFMYVCGQNLANTPRAVEIETRTVEPRFNEVAGDRPNLFVKSRVRYIENLDITNLRGNDQNVR